MIEALRSGVPSRMVGEYFSEARPGMIKRISSRLEGVCDSGHSDGMIFCGRYGEGKTHLLNTVFSMASSMNMVVSFVSLGKETPADRTYLLFRKLMANTYLPGAAQPGFRQKLEELTKGSAVSSELLAYSAKELQTDKLYYLLRAFLETGEEEERLAFLADLEGDFASNALIKRSYRRLTGKPAKFSQTFSKTKHGMDYMHFASHLFLQLGYSGWVILLDEAELIGRLGKKTRMKCYRNMYSLLYPDAKLEGVFSLFALSSSYTQDVIDKRNEYAIAEEVYAEEPDAARAVSTVLNAMVNAPELAPLSKSEILQILMSIQRFHGDAYDWSPEVSAEAVYDATEGGGYLLRTKIRAAIEFFDQLYLYGEAGKVRITQLGKEILEEEVPSLEEI